MFYTFNNVEHINRSFSTSWCKRNQTYLNNHMPACTVNYEGHDPLHPPAMKDPIVTWFQWKKCTFMIQQKKHLCVHWKQIQIQSDKWKLFSIYTAFLSLCIFIMKCAQKCFHNSVFSILSWICSLLPVFPLQWVQPAPLCVERRTRLKYSRACWTASQLKVSPSHLASKRLSQPQI